MILASDFDGTLFFMKEEVKFKKADIRAIDAFRKEGNLFGLCTGRTYQGVKAVMHDEVEFDFYIINTGAVILDKDLNILYEKLLEEGYGEVIYNEYKDKAAVIFQGRYSVHAFNPFYPHQTRISSLDEIEGGIHGLSLGFEKEEEAIEAARNINKKYHGILSAFSNKNFVDVAPFGCSKGQGIDFIKNYFKDKIAGIGDSYNDLPMLTHSDVSFTFKTSPLDIQEQVDYAVDNIAEAISILQRGI